MKKLLLIVLVAISANAGIFSTISGMTIPEIKPTEAYTVDTAGINPRVYEWRSKADSSMMCAALFSNAAEEGTSSAPSMFCWKSKK